jgi:hypothetical protein
VAAAVNVAEKKLSIMVASNQHTIWSRVMSDYLSQEVCGFGSSGGGRGVLFLTDVSTSVNRMRIMAEKAVQAKARACREVRAQSDAMRKPLLATRVCYFANDPHWQFLSGGSSTGSMETFAS